MVYQGTVFQQVPSLRSTGKHVEEGPEGKVPHSNCDDEIKPNHPLVEESDLLAAPILRVEMEVHADDTGEDVRCDPWREYRVKNEEMAAAI